MTGFLVLKLAVVFLLYLFLFATTGLIYRDLAVATAGGKRTLASLKNGPGYSLNARLVILESPGEQKGKFFELGGTVIIGRDDSCDIILDDLAASQRHARISKQRNSYLIEDLGSSNGTFLNNESIGKPASIKPGDRIQIGQTLLELVG